MRKRIVSLFALVAMLGVMLPGATFAQDERLQVSSDTSVVDTRLTTKTGTVGAMVQLNGEPTMLTYARSKAFTTNAQASRDAVQRLAEIEREQSRLINELTALNATVIYSAQRTYNGIAIYIDASNLEAVAKLNGVKAVWDLPTHTVDNTYSVDLIRAPELWAGLIDAGVELTGDGVSIGIIDTGIDYIHTDFGGPGTTEAYSENNTLIITDTIPGLTGTEPGQSFPTAKVVGGWDFVGDAYNAQIPGSMPMPDPDPMDCNGHGTHVAGTAAGLGVNADGTTYTGPYTDSLDPDSFRIGPGVAPEADLYALRVFGCAGSTNVTVEALEWAVDPNGDGDPADHLDVINMSLGSSDGSAYDASAEASDVAVLAGVIVVASAGNSGDSYYITGAPGVSARTISVASSLDAATVTDAIRVTQSPDASLIRNHAAFFSVNYAWTEAPTDTVVVDGELYYTEEDACQASDFAAGEITDKIVILRWEDGQCGSVTRGATIRNAGGAGMIIADNSEIFDLLLAGDSVIPAVSISKQTGDALIAAVQSGTVVVELDPALLQSFTDVNNNLADLLSAFSSRGPRRFDNALKPDITAPGQSIFSAATGTGDGGRTLNGTSMAAPHVAGSAALMRELHPAWDVEDIKALLMNTASKDLRADIPATSDLYNPSRIGAGRVDLVDAANADVIAYNADNLGYVSVSFGAVEVPVSTTVELSKTVWVENMGTDVMNYNVGYAPSLVIPGVVYTIEPQMITVNPSEAVSLTVTMSADANAMTRTRDSTMAATQNGFPRHYLSEASGNIVLHDTAGETPLFSASLAGFNEVPPTTSTVRAHATLMLNNDDTVTYMITPSTTFTITAGHIHAGAAGVNGGVVAPVSMGGTYGPTNPISGTTPALTAAQVEAMWAGEYYLNLHTAAFPGGEIRGQIVATGADLRVPVYANARPTSNMQAENTTIDFTDVMTSTEVITLTGDGLDQDGYLSLVSAFELVDSFESVTETGILSDAAEIQHLGISSNYNGVFTSTTEVYFGISSWGNWTTPREVEFDIYIDTDEDGTDDYVIYNTNYGTATGGDATDVFLTVVVDLNGGAAFDHYINLVSANIDTNVFNNRVMFIPATAEAIGLSETDTTFRYRVVTFSRENEEAVHETGYYRYDIANPTFDFMGGVVGPVYADQPGNTIEFDYDASNNYYNRSQGILLLHHHNGGADIDSEVVSVTNVPIEYPYAIYMPIVRK